MPRQSQPKPKAVLPARFSGAALEEVVVESIISPLTLKQCQHLLTEEPENLNDACIEILQKECPQCDLPETHSEMKVDKAASELK